MEDKTKITYPESEKVYMQGQLHPYLKVGMRKVNLTPTVVVENGKKVMTENAPVYIYDTSGAYSDPEQKVYRLLDFTDRPGDIDDPWYTNDFETAYREILRGCEGLLQTLKKK